MELKVDPIERFENLYKTYKDEKGVTKYREKIGQMPVMGEISLIIDFDDLLKFDPELGKNMLEKPEKHIEASSKAVKNVIEIDEKEYVERVEKKGDKFFARFKNLPTTNHISLRKLRAEHIGKFIMVDGILTRSSEVKPQIIEAAFQCQRCGRIIVRAQEGGPITAPPICDSPSCGRKGPFNLMEDMSKFIDWQKIRIQERPEELPPGQLPRTLDAILRRDLVDVARPGDRIAIVGLLRSSPTTQRRREVETFDIFLDTNYVDVSEKELEKVEITPDEEKVIIDLSKDEWIHQKVVASIAPSVFGNEAIKEAIALQLFAGVPKVLPDGMKIRGEPNVLLVGDPGTAKSQLLMYVARLAPRGLYTSGKGTTAAGLCISADSSVFLGDSIQPISKIVENELGLGEVSKYGETIEYGENSSNSQAIHSSNLKLKSQRISKVWKIRSPRKMMRIVTRTGRELKLTPQTSLFSIDRKNGLVWKPSESIRRKDRIAVARSLPVRSEKEVSTVFGLIKDYQRNIRLLNMEKEVRVLIEKIKAKFGIPIRDLAKMFNVCEDTLYRWANSNRVGNIPLQSFTKLCCLLGHNAERYFAEEIRIETKNGQKLALPRNLDEDWFYIMGLIMGDGRISVDRRNEGGYGGTTIGFSNRERVLLNLFETFFTNLGFKVSSSEESEKRPSERRIWSSLIYHILMKFGLGTSPKSDRTAPITEVIFYKKKFLYALLNGLFDTDGWIVVTSGKRAEVGFSSTSKKLVTFAQNALLTLGIISYVRKRKARTTTLKSGNKIHGRRDKYELTFSNYSDIETFKNSIGFKHPGKKQLLSEYCQTERKHHRNVDNIPGASFILKEIIEFYGYTSREITGRKHAFSPHNLKRSNISRKRLSNILKKMELNWLRHRVRMPYSSRNKLYQEIKKAISLDILCKRLKISRTQLYEYFLRRTRNPSVPIGIFVSLLKIAGEQLNSETLEFWKKHIKSVKEQHLVHSKNYGLLKSLCHSDIFWDEVAEATEIPAEEPYVYDLTIPGSHNFIANGIVVHNTAAVLRDETGGMTLEAGALVLADRGIAAIDEFDKMNPQDRVAIHEAMEQQTISIAKAGIVATLNARTAILAAANPALGRYNPYRSAAENIKFPVTLLSRFDLIFIITDRPEEEFDKRISDHILDLHRLRSTEPPIEPEILRKYIAYAKRNVRPMITKEAAERLKQFYLEMRSRGEDRDSPVPITARQLEALIRLAEARARIALRKEVTVEDSDAVIRLIDVSLRQVGIDKETGRYDIDTIMLGRPKSQQDKMDLLLRIIRELEEETGEAVPVDRLVDSAQEHELEKDFVMRAIEQLKSDGLIYEPKSGFVKRA